MRNSRAFFYSVVHYENVCVKIHTCRYIILFFFFIVIQTKKACVHGRYDHHHKKIMNQKCQLNVMLVKLYYLQRKNLQQSTFFCSIPIIFIVMTVNTIQGVGKLVYNLRIKKITIKKYDFLLIGSHHIILYYFDSSLQSLFKRESE